MDTPTRYVNHTEWEAQAGRQTVVLKANVDELLVGGARGSGKTELGLAWGAEPEYIEHPLFRGLVIRKDYEDLSDWVTRARVFYQGLGTITGKPAEIRWRAGGVTRLGHWKDRDTIGRYIGHEYQKMNIEELTQSIATRDEYISLMGSLRTSVPELKPQLYSSTNPGGVGHKWVKDYFVTMSRDVPYTDPVSGRMRMFIPMTIEDNPMLIKADPGYYNWLKNLPEPLRSAWYKGSWDLFMGQFFPEFGTHLRIEPHHIGAKAANRLFMSVDIGIGHNTSAGLWYKDDSGHIERLFSYLANGMNHKFHAAAIYSKIESFAEHIDGAFPVTAWIGHDARRRSQLDEAPERRPIDEYQEYFADRGKITHFIPVNPNKRYGCGLMHQVFDDSEGTAILSYWKGFNDTFEVGIQNAVTDPNDPEIYLKSPKVDPEVKAKSAQLNVCHETFVEDVCDEALYGVVGLYSDIATEKQKKRMGRGKPKFIPLNPDAYFQNNYADQIRDTALA